MRTEHVHLTHSPQRVLDSRVPVSSRRKSCRTSCRSARKNDTHDEDHGRSHHENSDNSPSRCLEEQHAGKHSEHEAVGCERYRWREKRTGSKSNVIRAVLEHCGRIATHKVPVRKMEVPVNESRDELYADVLNHTLLRARLPNESGASNQEETHNDNAIHDEVRTATAHSDPRGGRRGMRARSCRITEKLVQEQSRDALHNAENQRKPNESKPRRQRRDYVRRP